MGIRDTVKNIVHLAKAGNLDGAYDGYRALFSSAEFGAVSAGDRRQALRLMVLAKAVPSIPTAMMIDAHRAALAPATELVSESDEPADYEILGMCHYVVGNLEAAGTIFRRGLEMERSRNPSSDLCGELMKRLSMV